MRILLVILVLVCVAARGEGTIDFARYQVIIDRKPFGNEPSPEALAAAAASQAQASRESFAKHLKMSAVTRNLLNGKLQVGFMDSAAKKNYFLSAGESEDGITVVEVDYDREKALLRKEGEEVWLGMNDVAAVVTVAAAPAVSSGRRVVSGKPSARPAGADRPRQVVREVKVEKPKLTGEALTKHLENYQMDLIRAGGEKGPPLPMELTPEMDAQLVSEGVLPPLE